MAFVIKQIGLVLKESLIDEIAKFKLAICYWQSTANYKLPTTFHSYTNKTLITKHMLVRSL